MVWAYNINKLLLKGQAHSKCAGSPLRLARLCIKGWPIGTIHIQQQSQQQQHLTGLDNDQTTTTADVSNKDLPSCGVSCRSILPGLFWYRSSFSPSILQS
jgi:hypothetical protein